MLPAVCAFTPHRRNRQNRRNLVETHSLLEQGELRVSPFAALTAVMLPVTYGVPERGLHVAQHNREHVFIRPHWVTIGETGNGLARHAANPFATQERSVADYKPRS
jgi:hypothetical protein